MLKSVLKMDFSWSSFQMIWTIYFAFYVTFFHCFWQQLSMRYCRVILYYYTDDSVFLIFSFVLDHYSIPQSLAKLTVNFRSSLSISDSANEVANSTGTVGDSCNLQQYCDTGCQTDIMGEVGDTATPPFLPLQPVWGSVKWCAEEEA